MYLKGSWDLHSKQIHCNRDVEHHSLKVLFILQLVTVTLCVYHVNYNNKDFCHPSLAYIFLVEPRIILLKASAVSEFGCVSPEN